MHTVYLTDYELALIQVALNTAAVIENTNPELRMRLIEQLNARACRHDKNSLDDAMRLHQQRCESHLQDFDKVTQESIQQPVDAYVTRGKLDAAFPEHDKPVDWTDPAINERRDIPMDDAMNKLSRRPWSEVNGES